MSSPFWAGFAPVMFQAGRLPGLGAATAVGGLKSALKPRRDLHRAAVAEGLGSARWSGRTRLLREGQRALSSHAATAA